MSYKLTSNRQVYEAFVRVLEKDERYILYNAYNLNELGISDLMDLTNLLFELNIPFIGFYSVGADKFTDAGRNALADIAGDLLNENNPRAAKSLLNLRNIRGIDNLLRTMTPDDLQHIVQYKPHNL